MRGFFCSDMRPANHFEDILQQTISEEEVALMPVFFRLLLEGPSTDFILGRTFEFIVDDAFDKVTKTSADGLPLHDPKDWVRDESDRKFLARNLYHAGNCALLK